MTFQLPKQKRKFTLSHLTGCYSPKTQEALIKIKCHNKAFGSIYKMSSNIYSVEKPFIFLGWVNREC